MQRLSAIRRQKQNGAVSLFIVIFTALLITVVTISFVSIMARNQQQATADNLSQQAYDAANSGVEDAKRALLRLKSVCKSDSAKCDQDTATMNGRDCDVLAKMGIAGTVGSETLVQKTDAAAGGHDYDQAYTCVTIDVNTDDYLGTVRPSQPVVIPLKGKGAFNAVTLSWYTKDNAGSAQKPSYLDPMFSGATPTLYKKADWTPSTPPLLRSQLIQYGSSFTLDDFNVVDQDEGTSNSYTQFLYPAEVGDTSVAFDSDIRQNKAGQRLSQIECEPDFAKNYACQVSLELPSSLATGGKAKNSYLVLSGIYGAADYRVQLMKDAKVVQFDGVQPKVDSNGRADTVFRRVEARLQMGGSDNFPFPRGALDVENDICKNFTVTDSPDDYKTHC